MKNKLLILAGIGIIVAVVVTMAFYLTNIETLSIETILIVIIPLVLIASAAFILGDQIKNIRAGLPAKDERLKLIGYKAAYFGFISAIWSVVGAPLASGILFDYELTGHETSAVVVIISGVVFIGSYLILNKKGSY